MKLTGTRLGLGAAALLTIGGVAALMAPNTASAHTNASSADCSGVHGATYIFDPEDIYTMIISIDDQVVFSQVYNGGTTHSESVPQDGQAHTWSVRVDAENDAWDSSVSGTVGPCGETTTTSSTTTTSTTSTTTSTTLPPTTTEAPTTTEQATTTTEQATTTTEQATTTTDQATTTTQPPTTTQPATTTPAMLDISAIGPVCLRDAPYIEVTFGAQAQFNGQPATVTFIDLDGDVVGTDTATYQAGTTVRFVYPGASVDAAGNPTDWPGWMFDGDEWVVDPSDARLRDGLSVVIEVNPTATAMVSYPPATASCASPMQTPDPSTTTAAPPAGALPQTGSSTAVVAITAVILLLAGGATLVATRRSTAQH